MHNDPFSLPVIRVWNKIQISSTRLLRFLASVHVTEDELYHARVLCRSYSIAASLLLRCCSRGDGVICDGYIAHRLTSYWFQFWISIPHILYDVRTLQQISNLISNCWVILPPWILFTFAGIGIPYHNNVSNWVQYMRIARSLLALFIPF